MSIFLGNTKIAGGAGYHPNIFDVKWSDHIINDIQWLRADTFSWQSGSVYTTAYNHLVTDISGITAETETIGSYTVTFYRATDGHKICLTDQETIVNNIYTSYGIAWYYILDTTNTQFKLPRMKYKYWKNQTTLPVKGNGMTLGLTTGSVNLGLKLLTTTNYRLMGSRYVYGTDVGTIEDTAESLTNNQTYGVTTDSTKSGIVADVSDSIIETEFYLYFYVGEYTQTAIEQTAGITSEQLNNKVDLTLSNVTNANFLTKFQGCGQVYLKTSYVNGTSGYRIWSDGYCVQWGYSQASTSYSATGTVSFLKEFKDLNYKFLIDFNGETNAKLVGIRETGHRTTTSTGVVAAYDTAFYGYYFHWVVLGYLEEGQY